MNSLLRERMDASDANSGDCQGENNNSLTKSDFFYHDMLTNRHVLAALLIAIVSGSIMTSFNTTLPLHVQETFGWGTSTTGLVFLCLQAPAIVAGPLSGWLRDRIGVRFTAILSMLSFALMIWLLGVPGNRNFPWASDTPNGPAIYTTTMIAIGVVSPFLGGISVMELASTRPLFFLLFLRLIILV